MSSGAADRTKATTLFITAADALFFREPSTAIGAQASFPAFQQVGFFRYSQRFIPIARELYMCVPLDSCAGRPTRPSKKLKRAWGDACARRARCLDSRRGHERSQSLPRS